MDLKTDVFDRTKRAVALVQVCDIDDCFAHPDTILKLGRLRPR